MHKKQVRPLARLHGYWLHRRLLPRMQAWSRQEKQAWVFRRLKETLVRAAEGIPFYRERFREAGFDPLRHFDSVSDLERVPVLTKNDVRAKGEAMIDRRFLLGSVVANTSGTTGQPTTLRLNEGYVAFDYACMFRHWAKAGYTLRARFAAIRSYVPDTPNGPLWIQNRWQNTLYMSAYHLKPSNANRYLEALLQFRPPFLRGYVSSINVLAEFAYPHRDKFDFVRGVFTASETLSDLERANIERTFGPKLYDWYGMTEPAVVITERADHDGLEVDWEYGYPEFIADDALRSDERRLLATSLHNPVMPFIRYETGDLARVSEESDAAGLYPKVRAMAGRKDECIVTPDGARLPSLNFYSLLQTYTDILRFQFVQTDSTHVVMKLSVRPDAGNIAALVFALREEVGKRLGPDLELEIEITDQFLTSPDGKSPTFKRLLNPNPAGLPIRPNLTAH
jgi:phenylacetate-coenzyme A ligase PaaK-like adenylate-forming protein